MIWRRLEIPFTTKYGRKASLVALVALLVGTVYPAALMIFLLLVFAGYFFPLRRYDRVAQEEILKCVDEPKELPGSSLIWFVPGFLLASVISSLLNVADLSQYVEVDDIGPFYNLHLALSNIWMTESSASLENSSINIVSYLYTIQVFYFVLVDFVLMTFFCREARSWNYYDGGISKGIASIMLYTISSIGMIIVFYAFGSRLIISLTIFSISEMWSIPNLFISYFLVYCVLLGFLLSAYTAAFYFPSAFRRIIAK